MFLINNPIPNKKFSLNVETLSDESKTYTNVYGFKMAVSSGTIVVNGYTYPAAGNPSSLGGFGLLDSVQVDSIVVNASGGSCHVQYLTEVTA
jgi:hypothetical protein